MRWIWIDRAIEYEPGSRLVAVKLVSLAEEQMHSQFLPDPDLGPALPVMPNTLIIEGFAQTAGLLVGLRSGFEQKVVLAKISRAELTDDVGPGEAITFDARIERYDHAGASTTGVITRRAAQGNWDQVDEIGRIEMIFGHLDNNRAGMLFPDNNFVFGELFQTFLRTSGLERLAPELGGGVRQGQSVT